MIGGFTKFGGRSGDARALIAHLAKTQPGGSSFEAMNSAAPTMAAVVAEARLAAAARGIGDRPFWHIHLSPSAAMSEAGLRKAVAVVCREMGVTDHPVGIEYHSKPRRHGGAEIHAHLIIGRAAWSGNLLASGFEKIRLETACRVAELEAGDRHVLGRHHQTSVRYLEKAGRRDVVASLCEAHGETPKRPRGMSPEKRQALARGGVNGVNQRAVVRAAWEQSDGPAAFRSFLAQVGLTVRKGEKRGVYVVVDGETVIGAVDRLVGERRKAVAIRLRGIDAEILNDRPDPRPHDKDRPDGSPARRRPVGSAEAPDRDTGIAGRPGQRQQRRGEPSNRAPRASDDHDLEPVDAPGSDGERTVEDRRRRRAVAALTVSVAVRRSADRLHKLIDVARAVIQRDQEALRRYTQAIEPLQMEQQPKPNTPLASTTNPSAGDSQKEQDTYANQDLSGSFSRKRFSGIRLKNRVDKNFKVDGAAPYRGPRI